MLLYSDINGTWTKLDKGGVLTSSDHGQILEFQQEILNLVWPCDGRCDHFLKILLLEIRTTLFTPKYGLSQTDLDIFLQSMLCVLCVVSRCWHDVFQQTDSCHCQSAAAGWNGMVEPFSGSRIYSLHWYPERVNEISWDIIFGEGFILRGVFILSHQKCGCFPLLAPIHK